MKTLQVCHRNAAVGASTTGYITIANASLQSGTTENNTEITNRISGTFSHLYCRVIANDRGASTLTFRKNNAAGNMTVSIGASATGEFEDTSNTDSVAAADEYNARLVTGAGGTVFSLRVVAACFQADSGDAMRYSNAGNGSVSTASTTFYVPIYGDNQVTATTEAGTEQRFRTGGTLKNLCIMVSTNTRTSSTIRSRINGANGNISLAFTGTGLFEDTAHSDTIASGDLVNWSITTGTGTATCTFTTWSADFVPTAQAYHLGIRSQNFTTTYAAGTTRYECVGGRLAGNNTTESDIQTKNRDSYDVSHLWVYAPANTLTATSTVTFRKNAADTAVTVSIGSGATGEFEDTTNTVSIVADDEINYSIVAGGTGTNITITFISVLLTVPSAGVSAWFPNSLMMVGVGV